MGARMNRYAILTNRKRAVIALVHSFFFLLVAFMSFLGKAKAGLFFSATKPAGDWVMLGIYLVVSTILLILVCVSGCARERIYFAFCATSASFGLLRILLGDSHIFIAQYVRVGMLTCAVLTGYIILMRHSDTSLGENTPAVSFSE
jgi:ABC-type Na+ efflux pump permease subunit